MRAIAAGVSIGVSAALLAGCSSDGTETIRFTFSKREAIEFMTQVVNDYNASQDKVEVVIDTSGVDVVSASFVRGNPPDLMLANYNMEIARFIDRCTLSDLSETTAASQMTDTYQSLLDQYGVCAGRQSALPYSVMAASVIYNKDIFDANGIDVPTTWDELIAACEKLQAAGIDPFYATLASADAWTVGQGWFDYAVGGSLNVVDFYNDLAAEGADVGPDSEVSFSKDFAEPMDKMQQLLNTYINADARSRGYNDGNTAMAEGKAAMYLQGPWAFSEIAKTAPDGNFGTFPLPMTDDPDDLAVRVNLDLAAMIPEGSNHKDAARDFLEYLFQPEIIEAYNESQLGFTPTKTAAPPSDPRIEGMIPYVDEGKVYQGASVLVPKTIPVMNYAQTIALGGSIKNTLSTLDADWARLAFRAPAKKETEQ
ncbi:ABC transporter substrate-binding protein [Microbacterium gorillae]|uniref:ABC transporter substrate-binding protein n=1 Tax=Microbacterium gorillae TaxID=1231063 RepID=UPI003D996FFF